MIIGTGIDAVEIRRMRKFDAASAFIRRMFTEEERAAAPSAPEAAAAYYAARFAVREAVYKALAPGLGGRCIDLREIASLHRPDGSPYLVESLYMKELLRKAGAAAVHISVTTEAGLAIAVAVAEK